MSTVPVLSPEEIAGVLGGGEPAVVRQPAAVGPQHYSLRAPVAMPPELLIQAQESMGQLVATLAQAFTSEGAEVSIALEGLQQQQAQAALTVLPSPVWVISIVRPGGGGLALALDPAVGLALVDLALGGQGQCPAAGREPTPLETRLLTRVVGSALQGADRLRRAEDKPTLELHMGRIVPALAAPEETVGVGLLRVCVGGTDRSSLLLATVSVLMPPKRAVGQERRPPGPLAPLLEKLFVPARPVMCAGTVRLDELNALASGKVLRFDVDEDARLDLRAAERTIARGRIVRQSAGAVFAVDERVKRGRRNDR